MRGSKRGKKSVLVVNKKNKKRSCCSGCGECHDSGSVCVLLWARSKPSVCKHGTGRAGGQRRCGQQCWCCSVCALQHTERGGGRKGRKEGGWWETNKLSIQLLAASNTHDAHTDHCWSSACSSLSSSSIQTSRQFWFLAAEVVRYSEKKPAAARLYISKLQRNSLWWRYLVPPQPERFKPIMCLVELSDGRSNVSPQNSDGWNCFGGEWRRELSP